MRVLVLPLSGCVILGREPSLVHAPYHQGLFSPGCPVMPTPTQESALLRSRVSTETTFSRKAWTFGVGEDSLGCPGSYEGYLNALLEDPSAQMDSQVGASSC